MHQRQCSQLGASHQRQCKLLHLTTTICSQLGAWHGIIGSLMKWLTLQLKVILTLDIKHPISSKIYHPYNNLTEVSTNLAK